MTQPAELQQIAPHLYFCQVYDSKLKADLSSTVISTENGIFLVDPLPLTQVAADELLENNRVIGVVVTNGNHFRASARYSALFRVPIYARAEIPAKDSIVRITQVEDGTQINGALSVTAIDGAAPGEIALYSSDRGGTVILGDALINFEPHGFTFLPRKYCLSQKTMRRSLRKLLDRQLERILFAHGTPILSQGNRRLQELLDSAG